MLKFRFLPFLVFLIFLAVACGGQTVDKTLYVNAISLPCQEGGEPCLMVRESPDSSWTILSGGIKGFEFESGNDYELRVKASSDSDNPQGVTYKLLEVVSQEASPLWSNLPSPASLEEVTWYVQAMGPADSLHALFTSSTIMAKFNAVKNQVSGVGGCNNYFADYSVEGNQLTFKTPAATKRYCSPEAVAQQEQEYLSLLEQAQSFQIEQDQLIVSCKDGGKIIFQGR